MLTEIEIEDVGIYRLPNMWQYDRIKRVQGPNRVIAPLAFGLGMTIQQFKRLTPEQQNLVQQAYYRLTSPANVKKGI
ncbi:hypothetical protein [Sinorhizobium meliloti]|uniref:hypothetical protein n=1 Tax=Rhizobium meliloti TaxID=382 RepID=UPI000FDA6F3E|nr:hypothetical protein [Sinorhizobium meliloti]RVG50544.1 hypothetical protein CN226_21530 [Sinorhizobium meliloti]